MTITHAQILVWLLFWTLWALWGRATRHRTRTLMMGDARAYRFMHVAIVALSFWLLLTPILHPLNELLFDSPAAMDWIAEGLSIQGLVLAIWARMILADNWSGTIQQLSGQTLITKGPYRYVRHPIYSGILLAVFGTFLLKPTLFALIGFNLMFGAYCLKSLREEEFLRQVFGQQYTIYSKDSWRLIPFIF